LSNEIKANGGKGIPKDVLLGTKQAYEIKREGRTISLEGFSSPSKIAATILSPFNTGHFEHFMVQAKTGSGKTGAFLMCVFMDLDRTVRGPGPQVICVSPTPELALMVADKVEQMGACAGIKPAVLVDSRARTAPSPILVGTLGAIKKRISERRMNLSNLKLVVFDEADSLLDKMASFKKAVGNAMKRSKNKLRYMFISATFSVSDERFLKQTFFKKSSNKVYKLLVKNQKALKAGAVYLYHLHYPGKAGNKQQIQQVYNNWCSTFMEMLGSMVTVIFAEERAQVNALATHLEDEGDMSVSKITGRPMTDDERRKAIADFSSGATKVLIATNVIARGMDFPKSTLVVNLGLPRIGWKKSGRTAPSELHGDDTTFQHRIGRAGRFGRPGAALTITMTDHELRYFNEIIDARELRGEIHKMPWTTDPAKDAEKIKSVISQAQALRTDNSTAASGGDGKAW